MKPLSIYLTDQLDAQTREAAQRERRSVSNFARIALEEKIARADAEAAPDSAPRPRASSSESAAA
jgi:predicted transcriptional regulator